MLPIAPLHTPAFCPLVPDDVSMGRSIPPSLSVDALAYRTAEKNPLFLATNTKAISMTLSSNLIEALPFCMVFMASLFHSTDKHMPVIPSHNINETWGKPQTHSSLRSVSECLECKIERWGLGTPLGDPILIWARLGGRDWGYEPRMR